MRKALLFLAVIGVYLFVRFSDIDKPLDYNGWTTAQVLVTQQIWYENGIQKYYFSPVFTFNNQNDKNIKNIGGLKDNQGNYYYVSYPPLSFLLPFSIFKLLGIYPALLPLNIFSTFLHITSAISIYLLISLFKNDEKRAGLDKRAFIGYILYLFSPGNFWFYTNIYFADILVNTIFISGVYLILRIILKKKFHSKLHLLLFGILIFVMVYTEWLGLFFSISVLLYSGICAKKDKRYLTLFFITAISTFIAILLTLFQYASISGFPGLIIELQNKFLTRGGFNSFLKLKPYLNVIYFYKTYYSFEILVLIMLSLISFCFLPGKIRKWLKDGYIFLYFAFVPVALHYLFFFNFNHNHSFSSLKTSPLLITLISLLLHKVIQSLIPKAEKLYYIFAVLFITSSTVVYTQHTFSDYRKYNYQLLGREIRESSIIDDNIFICGYPDGFIEPQVLYYSHRNIRHCRDKKEAEDIITKLNIGKSVIFTLSQDRQIINKERFND